MFTRGYFFVLVSPVPFRSWNYLGSIPWVPDASFFCVFKIMLVSTCIYQQKNKGSWYLYIIYNLHVSMYIYIYIYVYLYVSICIYQQKKQRKFNIAPDVCDFLHWEMTVSWEECHPRSIIPVPAPLLSSGCTTPVGWWFKNSWESQSIFYIYIDYPI